MSRLALQLRRLQRAANEHPLALAAALLALILLADQCFKVYIKTHFVLGEELDVLGRWFRLHFVENNGMAFGMELWGATAGKLLLTAFRLAAVAAIGYYLVLLCRWRSRDDEEKRPPMGLIVCVTLVLAGAIGNIFDSVFYGVLFSSSWGEVAQFLPPDGGYSTWLQGRVVDMLYFPLIEGTFPDWLPLWGGEHFIFFRPVFNVADAAISCGIIALILFERKALGEHLKF